MKVDLKINDKILLSIKKIGINGEGIGYYKRLAIFVPNTLRDEEVEVTITKVLDNYAIGSVTKYKVKSKDRVDPVCSHFGQCGGCQLLHLKYSVQLKEKREILIESLEKYLEKDVDNIIVESTIGMENPFYYRNKTALPIRHDGDKVVAGMYAIKTNKLVYIEKCILETKVVSDTLSKVLDNLTRINVDIYNPRFKQGNIRYVIVRGFIDVEVTFVLMYEDKKLIDKLKNMYNKIDNLVSVNYSINNDLDSHLLISNDVINIAGKSIQGKLRDLEFTLYPDSFFQLNIHMYEKMLEKIIELVEFKKSDVVYDLYTGVGTIALSLAKLVGKIIGVDDNLSNIKNANSIAKQNNITNCEFKFGDSYKILSEVNNLTINTVIVDPPRSGLDIRLLKLLVNLRVKKIIYISCNPSTLAKNLAHLQTQYRIEKIVPFDMFPNTSNVEAVCVLTRK